MSHPKPRLTVLGIETSCDETAAAIVRVPAAGVQSADGGAGGDGFDGPAEILADVVWSQIEDHAPYRGVVPEIAARAHVEKVDAAVAAALAEAGLGFGDLDGVAATAGPGLIGGVMVGLLTGKAIALAHGLPLIAVNHLEGHALSPRLGAATPFPYLLLLASGGHCQFLAVDGLGQYRRLGSTIDDAAGEAFDKTAKLLGLGFPGGPLVEAAARGGTAARFDLPRPLVGRPGCDLSFAGLKTAVARQAAALAPLSPKDQADLAAAFQAAVVDVLADRTRAAMRLAPDSRRLVLAGGVAANQAIRKALEAIAESQGWSFAAPPLRHCTDNAAMIALAGAERLRAGLDDPLEAPARARWPLDAAAAAAAPVHKPGRKGAKA
ncbi:MAG: tRNA (adenosine(37)-N6)-threonylcarbamoyltransferase complex transferase subunit TsaD [Alphaproteobacteria bacterium]|nr:tRNA (adenosine(37)-N6)-threonylcarbamoyltransferase complex transferase subunit TsaD [Alphaproteobacteria bacterium]